MNILFLSHRFPYPPTRGDKIRSFNMVKHLQGAGHKVTVASLARSAEEAAECQGIADYCEEFVLCEVRNPFQALRMGARLLTSEPSSMGFFYSRALQTEVNRLLDKTAFDLIVVFSSTAAQYVSHVTTIPKLLDFCDMDSQKWLAFANFKPWPVSFGYRLEGRKLEREEKKLCGEFDLCSCATDFEVDTLDSYQTGVASGFFPNGVDFDFFTPDGQAGDADYDPYGISFVGRMDYYPNEECVLSFCDTVLPKLREKYPEANLTVIGAEPPANILALNNRPGITVTGTVDDIRTYVRKSAVMVTPLEIARGTQNKILEGMAMGVPVVSSRTAARGVDAVVGEHILAATTPEEYVAHISHLFEDSTARKRLAIAGRERVMSHHNWPRAMTLFDDCITRTLTAFTEKHKTKEFN
ncbi:TIGR03087 family PEP-CTERM/XrtA system glycosyltransferase [Paremcibacter congregatus]|uniref:TIGR03087 family PEP-CTERM/XrtA system glycosyltransferase n=1 Tax=Paremcibacter congregatus TaxID=2043170 RepID=UPI003A8D22D0